MNILQHLDPKTCGNVLVTLNPPNDLKPRPELMQGDKIEYRHPLYTNAAVRAQRKLANIQGRRGIWYAGAWTGYGFHEDGCTSGLQVARKLGGSTPFEIVDLRVAKPLPEMDFLQEVSRIIVQFPLLFARLFYVIWLLICLAGTVVLGPIGFIKPVKTTADQRRTKLENIRMNGDPRAKETAQL
jgi:hypothetical protein